MSHGEEKAKRWPVSTRDLFLTTFGVAISSVLLAHAFANTEQLRQGSWFFIAVHFLGWFTLGGSIGALVARYVSKSGRIGPIVLGFLVGGGALLLCPGWLLFLRETGYPD